MAEHVTIYEVGPRDGLQNEPVVIPTPTKTGLVDRLSACGFSRIEVTSFVSPKWVPQMADAAEVMAGIERAEGVTYAALTPNERGYAAAREAGAGEVAVFASASEGFSRANINCSVAESLERFRPVAEAAARDGVRLRAYVSCVTDCPYDGRVDPGEVARVAEALAAMGAYEVSLGDTIGRATPETTEAMLKAVSQAVPVARLAGHFHDTGGLALDNIEAAFEYGLRSFDAAAGGLGGCPYAQGATGNVDTVAVAGLIDRLGHSHGLDLTRLGEAAAFALTLKGSR